MQVEVSLPAEFRQQLAACSAQCIAEINLTSALPHGDCGEMDAARVLLVEHPRAVLLPKALMWLIVSLDVVVLAASLGVQGGKHKM